MKSPCPVARSLVLLVCLVFSQRSKRSKRLSLCCKALPRGDSAQPLQATFDGSMIQRWIQHDPSVSPHFVQPNITKHNQSEETDSSSVWILHDLTLSYIMNSIVPPGSGPKAVNSSGMAIICSITPETSQNRVFQRAENGKLYTIATPPCLQCACLAAGSTVRQAFRSSQQKILKYANMIG